MAINLFGVVFVRKDVWEHRSETAKKITLNHEAIHTAQMKELLYIFFYIIYGLEWFVRLFINGSKAYDNVSFEKEAYAHLLEFDYLENRIHYAEWRKEELLKPKRWWEK